MVLARTRIGALLPHEREHRTRTGQPATARGRGPRLGLGVASDEVPGRERPGRQMGTELLNDRTSGGRPGDTLESHNQIFA